MSTPSPAPGDPALFVPDGPRLVPTDRARGPWSPNALHGGPVAALVARAAESHPGGEDFQLTRVTLELLRPVPMTPLGLTSALAKPGRTVQLVDTVVEADGVEVAWARALRIRRASDDRRVEPTVPEDDAPAPPDGLPATAMVAGELPAFHNQGVEMRFVSGRTNHVGPATVGSGCGARWSSGRIPRRGSGRRPWPTSATGCRPNSTSCRLLHQPRPHRLGSSTPGREWVCLDARTRFGSPGIGAAESELWDTEGRIGRSIQSLVVEARS